MTGYVSSGRFMADVSFDEAKEARRFAHWCRRQGLRREFHEWMRKARRAIENHRYYKARIVK